jgi:hypothetical protein
MADADREIEELRERADEVRDQIDEAEESVDETDLTNVDGPAYHESGDIEPHLDDQNIVPG